MKEIRKDFYEEINKNKIKTFFLIALFIILLGVLGVAVSYILSGTFSFGILTIAGIIAIIYALVGYYSGDKIVLASTKAVKADTEKYIYLHNVVEGLAIAAGIPKPNLYVINDPSPNAFATGRDPNHSSIAVTTGLLEILNREELEGVIAHEMSHIQNQDIKIMTLTTVLFGIIAIVSDIALRSMLFSRGGSKDNKSPIIMIIALLFIVLSPIIGLIIQMTISRNREYLADSNGVKLTRYPKGLANALRKISNLNKPTKTATKGTAHLYISNPVSARKINGLFSTHPPIEERIKILESM
jgi:heat shock protein HtpX